MSRQHSSEEDGRPWEPLPRPWAALRCWSSESDFPMPKKERVFDGKPTYKWVQMESVTPYGRGQEYFSLQLEDPLQPVYQIEDNLFLFIMDCSEKKTIGCGRSSFFPKHGPRTAASVQLEVTWTAASEAQQALEGVPMLSGLAVSKNLLWYCIPVGGVSLAIDIFIELFICLFVCFKD